MRQNVQWHILLEDDEWESETDFRTLLPENQHAQQGIGRRIFWLTFLGAVCLLIIVGAWLRQQAQAGLSQVESQLEESVAVDLVSGDWQPAQVVVNEAPISTQIAGTHSNRDVKIRHFELHENRALVELRIDDPALAYPFIETRFYQESSLGWRRTWPDPTLWGSPQSFRSDYFLFHFREKDRAAVEEAAPLLDGLVTELQERFHPLLTDPQMPLVVEITLDGPPLDLAGGNGSSKPLLVRSPLLLPRPAHVSPGRLLYETVALPLVFDAGREIATPLPINWSQSVIGLQMWLLWEMDGLVAAPLPDVLRWFLEEYRLDRDERPTSLPAMYDQLCQTAAIWDLYPFNFGLPFTCEDDEPMLAPYRQHELKLTKINMPDHDYWQYGAAFTGFVPARTLLVALVYDYIEEEYGPQAVPHMLQRLSEFYSWQLLTPAFFGVSAQEFESGWQTHIQVMMSE